MKVHALVRRTTVAIVALATVASINTPVVAQEPTITFRSGVEAVTLSAIVKDQRGRVVKDLQKADFEVLDGGFARQIKDFHAGDAAVSLAHTSPLRERRPP